MLDKNDLLAISELLKPIYSRLDTVDSRFDAVDKRLDSIDERLSNVEENTKVTREAVNALLEWADDSSIQEYPIFKKAK